nr:uncharacterized protein LOC111423984 [Onthophagus taurus]
MLVIIQYNELNTTNNDRLALEIIAKYFKDKIEHILYKFEEYNIEEIESSMMILTPCVAEIAGSFIVFIEKKQVVEVDNLIEAFELCFGLYFIQNTQYPKVISGLLETIQCYFLKVTQKEAVL